MRSIYLEVLNATELKVIVAAITDFVEMTEDMRIEPAQKLASLKGSAFNECLDEINTMNRRIESGKALVAHLNRTHEVLPAGITMYEDEADVLRAGLEMDVGCGFEMEPFYALLRDKTIDYYSRVCIERLKDEVNEGVAKLDAMKDVLARLNTAR